MITASLITPMLYASGLATFVLTDSIEAAVITAIIAGVFTVVNTVLNGTIFKKVDRIENKTNRLFELHGERKTDKSITRPGRNDISDTLIDPLTEDRRESRRKS